MGYDWIWQGILLMLIAWAMEPIRRLIERTHPTWVQWFPPIWSYMRNLAVLCIIYYVFVGHPVLYAPSPSVTPNNVESQLNTWLGQAGYLCSPSTDESYLFFIQCVSSTHTVGIGRFKSPSDSLVLSATTAITDDRSAKLAQISPDELTKLIQDVRISTVQFGFQYRPAENLRRGTWPILKYIHIEDGMKREVLDTVRLLPFAATSVEQIVNRRLDIKTDIPKL